MLTHNSNKLTASKLVVLPMDTSRLGVQIAHVASPMMGSLAYEIHVHPRKIA